MLPTENVLINGLRATAAVGQAMGEIQLKNTAAMQAMSNELASLRLLVSGAKSFAPAETVASQAYGDAVNTIQES